MIEHFLITLLSNLKDVLLRLNLNIDDARGQCYDGASTMSGRKSGVATKVKEVNPQCLYIQCYGHSLNLAVGDAIKKEQFLSDSFDIGEICKLVKYSPQREKHLKKIREEADNIFMHSVLLGGQFVVRLVAQ